MPGDDLPEAHPIMVGNEEPSKMEALRDSLVEVRSQEIEYAKPDGQKIQTRKAALRAIDAAAEARLERKEQQYDEMKDAAKG